MRLPAWNSSNILKNNGALAPADWSLGVCFFPEVLKGPWSRSPCLQIKFKQLYLLAEGQNPNRMQCNSKLSEARAAHSGNRESLTPEGKEGIGKPKENATPKPLQKPMLCSELWCCFFLAWPTNSLCLWWPHFYSFPHAGEPGPIWSQVATFAILHGPNQLCDCLMCHLTQREALTFPL